MADVWKKIKGIMGDLFKIGGPYGPTLKNSSGAVEVRDTTDVAYATGRAAHIVSGALANDLVTLLDLQASGPNITFDFAGASPPLPGTNTNKFGFVHTTGGLYTAGQVVYDDGVSLIILPTEVVQQLTTSTAISGTISLIENGFYVWEGSSWVLKGDGDSKGWTVVYAGQVRTIETDYHHVVGKMTIEDTGKLVIEDDAALILV